MPTFTRSASWYTALACFSGSLAVLYLPWIWAAYLLTLAGGVSLFVYVFREYA